MRKLFAEIYHGVGKWCLKHDLITSSLLTLIMGISIGVIITMLDNMLV